MRPAVERLAGVRHAAELLGGDVLPADLRVLQLPAAAAERWLALPFTGEPAAAELALVVVGARGLRFDRPLAGLSCDAWSELIPAREETTGIAFHHDAPGARPPQALLLAVPPVAGAPWSLDVLLDSVAEARELAQLRAVGPRQLEWLGTLLPAVYLPQAFSTDVPGVKLAELAARHPPASSVLGKE